MKTTSYDFLFLFGGRGEGGGAGLNGNVKVATRFQNTHFRIDAKCKTFIRK